jgi:hypothetical protein
MPGDLGTSTKSSTNALNIVSRGGLMVGSEYTGLSRAAIFTTGGMGFLISTRHVITCAHVVVSEAKVLGKLMVASEPEAAKVPGQELLDLLALWSEQDASTPDPDFDKDYAELQSGPLKFYSPR